MPARLPALAWRRCGLLALVMCLVLTPALASPAHAEPVPGVDCTQFPVLCDSDSGRIAINSVAELAPQADAPVDATNGADTAAQAIVAQGQGVTTASDSHGGDDVVTGVAEALSASGAADFLIVAPHTIPVVGYGVAAFGTGFAIGTGVRWLVGKIFGGSDPVQQTQWSNERWVAVAGGSVPWTPTPPDREYLGPGDGSIAGWSSCAGHWSCYSAGPNMTIPRDGFLFEYDMYNTTYSLYPFAQGFYQGSPWPYCPDGPRPPALGVEIDGFAEFNCNGQQVAFRFATATDLQNHTTPLTIQSSPPAGYTQASPPQTPTRSQFATGLGQAINEHPDYGKWLEHELSPRCHADPTSTTVNVPEMLESETLGSFESCLQQLGLTYSVTTLPEADIDYGPGYPVMSDPGNDASTAPASNVTIYVNPPASGWNTQEDERCRPSNSQAPSDPGVAPPGFTGADPRFAFRPDPAPNGYPGSDWTQDPPASTTVWLNWGDERWGYRHIMIRHGYGPGDEQDTADALLDPAPVHEGGTTWLFYKHYTASDPTTGAPLNCVRGVVVNFYHRPYEPRARDIITSWFGLVTA